VDVQFLADDLAALKANTYNWLIWHAPTDWDDLQLFLPLARAKGIRVWVTLVPPTESPPMYGENYSEPFRLDFRRWAVELAKLSLREPNLVAWSLDDFTDNAGPAHTFKPEDWREILTAARAINPKLAFVPCCYYQHITPELAAHYRDLVDGILFPYMHASSAMNLRDNDTLAAEVARFKTLFGAATPVFVDVYATHHTSLNPTTAEYVEQVMTAGRSSADGVLIYCHHYEKANPEKYRVIKQLFHRWGAEDGAPR
jgi:hypothetical protein